VNELMYQIKMIGL